jgi:hypothetical protein
MKLLYVVSDEYFATRRMGTPLEHHRGKFKLKPGVNHPGSRRMAVSNDHFPPNTSVGSRFGNWEEIFKAIHMGLKIVEQLSQLLQMGSFLLGNFAQNCLASFIFAPLECAGIKVQGLGFDGHGQRYHVPW